MFYRVFRKNRKRSFALNLATKLLHTTYLATLLSTTLLSLLKSTETVSGLFISVLSTSAFQPAKSDSAASLDV